MSEPSRSTSRHVIAGATLAVIGVAAAGFALGRSTAEPTPAPAASVPLPAPTPSPTPAALLPTVQAPLGRAELIRAAAGAASAFAAGQSFPAEIAALAGREFELQLPFGCPGRPQPEDAKLTWVYDAEAEALRVRAEPVSWLPDEWLPPTPAEAPAQTGPEAIEGFWIARPWLLSDACPAALPPEPGIAAAADPGEQTLGLAVFFAPNSSRVGRRNGRAYQTVANVAPDAMDVSQGLRLRLRGTLAARPAVILCRAGAAADARPLCLISAQLDEVAVVNPAKGETLATWNVAGDVSGPAR